LLVVLGRLRQFCDHPALAVPKEKDNLSDEVFSLFLFLFI